MFIKFINKEKLKNKQGSAYIELAYCKNKQKDITKLYNVNNLPYWQEDSLYVSINNLNNFIAEYKSLFGKIVLPNKTTNFFDEFGINYFSVENTKNIIEQLNLFKPEEYEILLNWLQIAKDNNGFYILGI